MKTRAQLLVIGLALASSLAIAQPFGSNRSEMGKGQRNDESRNIKLSDEQRESLKKIHNTYANEFKSLQLQIAELKAVQKTLMESSAPDIKKIEKNIDQIVSLEKDAASKKLALHLDVKKQFPEMNPRLFIYSNSPRHKMNNEHAFNKGQHTGYKGNNNHKAGLKKQKRTHENCSNQGGNSPQKAKVKPIGQKTKANPVYAAQHLALSASTRELRNKLGELQAKERTMLATENPDMKVIGKNMDQIAEVKGKIMKIHAKAHIDMLSKMTPEEKEKFLLAKDKRQNSPFAKGKRHSKR